MMIRVITLLCLLALPMSALASECVVLLHGLWPVSESMAELQSKLERSGYQTSYVTYPSRQNTIPELAASAVGEGVASCRKQSARSIHFVTHSLGSILLRVYLQQTALPELGRVVMLGPPNQGSQLAEAVQSWPLAGWLLGPAGLALGTDESSLVQQLPPVDFELGVIAGTLAINPLGLLFIDGPNDSVVSVASTRVEGMDDHVVLPVLHSIMMRDNEVIDHSIHFLKTGNFIPQ